MIRLVSEMANVQNYFRISKIKRVNLFVNISNEVMRETVIIYVTYNLY